MRYFYCD